MIISYSYASLLSNNFCFFFREEMQYLNSELVFPYVNPDEPMLENILQINSFGLSPDPLQLTEDHINDIKTIPSLKPMLQMFPDQVIQSVVADYMKTTALIVSGLLELDTSIQDLSDIQVLLLIRGDGYSSEKRNYWKTKLRNRFAYIDINIILEYL